jgi:diadenosine tetraphosphatase ApaH/serine/threonine PP2A family protein phosphatase
MAPPPMRIALLADVHANLEALAACIEHARKAEAGRHVFLGDLVGYGADPGPVLDKVIALVAGGGVAVLGNHDFAVVRGTSPQMNPEARTVVEWTRAHLLPSQLDFLEALPLTVVEDGRLYVHANAWAPERWEYITSPFDAGRSLRATPCRLTFCGHVHTPALYHAAADGRTSAFAPVSGTGIPLLAPRRWLALPGSVGQSRDGNPAASYAVFDDASGLLTFHRVPYDVEVPLRKIRGAGLPQFFNAFPESRR